MDILDICGTVCNVGMDSNILRESYIKSGVNETSTLFFPLSLFDILICALTTLFGVFLQIKLVKLNLIS